MMHAIVYKKRNFWLAALTLLCVAIVSFLVIFLGAPAFIVAVLLILLFYLALRVPLLVLAKNMRKVEVENIVEVKASTYECLKALLRYSKLFLASFVFLLSLTFAVLLVKPAYAIFPLNLFLVLIVSSASESSKIVVCREGVVDGRGVLNPWEDLKGCEVKDSWILVKKRLGLPIVIPRNEKVERVLLELIKVLDLKNKS